MNTDWDQKYRETPDAFYSQPREWLTDHASLLPAGGLAFEAAAGLGSNLPFLDEHGFSIIAADRSPNAVRLAHQRCGRACVVQADLSRYHLAESAFDLIVNFYYLEWSLFDQFTRALRPGGVVVIESLTVDMLANKPDITACHLLQPGQLREYFSHMDILEYREGWVESARGHQKAVASVIARKR